MATGYTFVENLFDKMETPEEGTLSNVMFNDDKAKIVLFKFSANQELSEHTTSNPAMLQFLKGKATVTLGDDSFETVPGTSIHMDANLPHRVRTKTPVVMLLILFR